MQFAIPAGDAEQLVHEARDLIAGPVQAALTQRPPAGTPYLEPDGHLAPAARSLKATMHHIGAQAGLYAPFISQRLGGRGTSLRSSMYLHEEVFRHGFAGQQWILGWTDGPNPMLELATPRAERDFVQPLMRAEITTAFALTEPHAGSDATRITTTARRAGDQWVIDGHKYLITNAPFADVIQVVARTEDGLFGVFLVPAATPGFQRGPLLQTIMNDGQTGELLFHGCHIPHDMQLGQPAPHFAVPMRWINWTRSRRAGMCIGLARHCLDRALAYAKERPAFGKPIASYEQVAIPLSEAYRHTWNARVACDRLLAEIDAADPWQRPDAATRANFAAIKLLGEECLLEAVNVAIQVFGGRGLLRSTGLEHIFRVARNLQIPGGTVELQRRTIARSLGLLDDEPVSQPERKS
ncbi:MAG: acyl-CoA dehydrogenase [Herpetosiphon sp.]